MRWKTTLILLLATIGIGAYLSLYEIRQPAPEARERRAKQVIRVEPDAATQFVLDMPKVKATLTRHGAEWTITPSGFRANPDTVNALLGDLSPLTAERVLKGSATHPLDLKSFGLDPAIGWLSVAANEKPSTLLIGAETPVAQHRYAKMANRPDVFVIPSQVFDDANQPLEQWRDPRCFDFVAPTVAKVELERDKIRWTIERTKATSSGEPAGWREIESQAMLETSNVESFLNTVAGLRLSGFVEDAPTELTRYGLAQPAGTITVWIEGREAPQRLSVGGSTGQTPGRYGRMEGRVDIIRLPETVMDLLATPLERLRQPPSDHVGTDSSKSNATVWTSSEDSNGLVR